MAERIEGAVSVQSQLTMCWSCYYTWCQHCGADCVCSVYLTCGRLTFYAADCYIIRYWVYVSHVNGYSRYVAVDYAVAHL